MPSSSSARSSRPFDLQGLLEALARAEVEFIVVGGVGAALQGVPYTTFDLDIVHSRSPENRRRLTRTFEELDACLREHLPKRLEPTEEQLDTPGHMLLATRLGPLDVLGSVSGGRDFESLVGRSEWLELHSGLRVRVLRLAELIAIKEATGREKDRLQLPLLRRTLEERGE